MASEDFQWWKRSVVVVEVRCSPEESAGQKVNWNNAKGSEMGLNEERRTQNEECNYLFPAGGFVRRKRRRLQADAAFQIIQVEGLDVRV